MSGVGAKVKDVVGILYFNIVLGALTRIKQDFKNVNTFSIN